MALVAPGGAVTPERVEGTVRLLEARGLRVSVREDIASRCRYLAGSDERRANELREALDDPEVRAVFLARGGYGTQRILDRIEGVGSPRCVVGFSDNTALLHLLRQKFGWAVLHGPHPREEAPDELDAVLATFGYYGEPSRFAARGLHLWNRGPWGQVVAEVAGGCLAILASSEGTPHAFSGAGRIVLLEDVGEPVYRIDRMLQQLRASGALEGARAVVFGRLSSFLAAGEELAVLEGLLEEFAASSPFPVLSGLPCGHTEPNLPLPFGPRALLDFDGEETGHLALVEAMVR